MNPVAPREVGPRNSTRSRHEGLQNADAVCVVAPLEPIVALPHARQKHCAPAHQPAKSGTRPCDGLTAEP
jgi:hypothetical protein